MPIAFFMRHVSETSGIGYMKLCISSGRVRTVQYQSGWRAFVVDNELQKGDACIFELMPTGNAQFKVVTFRADQCSNCCCSPSKTGDIVEPIVNQMEGPNQESG
ncbi:hypothetical protein BT93_A2287 [Corymbia citriodora subsp. variegata]|nr:hypothetical protein BT93_A2287 [Corymbia citriodora subsp. variegata]